MFGTLASVALACVAAVRAQEAPPFGDPASVLELAREGAAALPTPPARAFAVPRRGPGADDPWKRVVAPSRQPAESIGAHSAGCLAGAVALPPSGPGYEVMRPSRRRFFGHPRLIAFVEGLGAAAARDGLGSILVGDLSQPRGGPTLSGHASHQTGLDADIWYRRWPAGAPIGDSQRETEASPSLVVPDFERLTARWDPRTIDLLKDAASSPEVERIFVNPVIKREACAARRGEAWLGKLRPWWGHDDHFHARLTCAPGDAACRSAADPVPPGDGCGADLAAWFTPASKAEARRQRTEAGPPPKMPVLPPRCAAVLAAP